MDIVERLRKHFRPWADDRDDQRLYAEAADEIERLREALDEAIYLLNPTQEDMEKKTGIYRIVSARAALKGNDK